MRTTYRLNGFLLFFALVACAPATGVYVYKNGGTVARTDKDYFDCELAASRNVPTDTRIATTPTYTTPTQTNCYDAGYAIQCTTTGGQVQGGQTYSYDANSELRRGYVARCLASKGYSAVRLPICDTSKIPQSVLQRLSGSQRPPQDGACIVPITQNAGNVLYQNEFKG